MRVAARDMAQRTLDDYTRDSVPLKAYFGKMDPLALEPVHKGEWLDLNLEHGRPVRGNREFACLSAMMSWLVRKNLAGVKSNPFLKCGIKRNKETKRARYVEHDEMRKTLENAPLMVRVLAELVYRTLQRPEDILEWTPNETYAALQADSYRLVSMGARTLIDLYMTESVGDIGGFERKLDELLNKGLISKRHLELLKVALDAGHAATHRAHKPTLRDLNTVIDIVENLLQPLALGIDAEGLKERTPVRKPPSPDTSV